MKTNFLNLIALVAGLAVVSACTTRHDSTASSNLKTRSFASIQAAILTPKCGTCHSGLTPLGGVNLEDYAHVASFVSSGNPDQSVLLRSIQSGRMPPGARLAAGDVAEIQDWIAGGARNDVDLAVESISPSAGSIGAVSVKVLGQGFTSGSKVTFDNQPAETVFYISSNQLIAVTPQLPSGSHSVTVTNSDNSSATLPAAYSAGASSVSSDISISSIFPTSGKPGDDIKITGNNFATGATVMVGNRSCRITSISTTEIYCTTDPNELLTAYLNVTVTNPDNKSFVFLNGRFSEVSSGFTSVLTNILVPKCVTCHSGSGAPMGIRLDSYSNVMASGSVIPGDADHSTIYTKLVAKVTPHQVTQAQLYAVRNWVADGGVDDTAPSVTSISPSSGPVVGGTAVAINVTRPGSTPSVYVNDAPCTPANVNAAQTQITCITASAAAGVGDVVVVRAPANGLPSSSGRGANLFTYLLSPIITAVNPSSKKSSDLSAVTISGKNFTPGIVFRYGNVDGVTNGNPACDTNNICTASSTPPILTPGTYNVRATLTNGQFGDFPNGLTITTGDAPVLTSVTDSIAGAASPTFAYTSLPNNGVQTMTLTGTGILPGAQGLFGATACTNATVTPTQITCRLPNNLTANPNLPVTIKNPDGLSSNQLTINLIQQIAITTINPTTLPVGGGIITITGQGIQSLATATIGGAPCAPFQVNSATSAACGVPAAPNGIAAPANLVITNPLDPAGNSFSATRAFSYAITLSDVTPNSGPVAGGTSITLTATGFATDATVQLGANPCANPSFTATTITCTTPAAAAAGAVTVTVKNANGAIGTLANGYLYQ